MICNLCRGEGQILIWRSAKEFPDVYGEDKDFKLPFAELCPKCHPRATTNRTARDLEEAYARGRK